MTQTNSFGVPNIGADTPKVEPGPVNLSQRYKAKPARHTFTPPEGVPIEFDLAQTGSRLGAQLLDFVITYGGAIVFVIALVYLGVLPGSALFALAFLLFFLIRIPYYVLSELVWNGRTLGKRVVNIRVISADGRHLTPYQITARNLMKEVEFFLPLTFLLTLEDDDGVSLLVKIIWLIVVMIIPFTNKRRQRLGDMIAGTLVVEQPKPILLRDLASEKPNHYEQRFSFLSHQLEHYGRFELQTLETILRDVSRSPAAQSEIDKVTKAIARKIDYTDPIPTAHQRDFLRAFYRAQREHLEARGLFGDKREDKFYRSKAKDKSG